MRYPKPPKEGFLQVAEATRRSMSSNRGSGTKLEIALRKALWAVGLRGYRVNVRHLPGKPDVVFGKRKLAVFVNGCFWHGCPHCGRFTYPKKNADYWREKIEANRERDAAVRVQLAELGYSVLTLWECEIKADIDSCIERVREALNSRPPDRKSKTRSPSSAPEKRAGPEPT